MCASSAWTGASPHINKSELMCKKGCGYFGNPAWDGHCSKCFKELLNKRQKRPVFDPTIKTTIKNRVSRSVSDVTEFPYKATSLVTRKLDKQQLQLGRRTKIVKDIFRLSHSPKADPTLLPQLSSESQAAYDDLQSLLKTLCEDASVGILKNIKLFVEKISKIGNSTPVDDLGELFHEFYYSLDIFLTNMSSVWKLEDEKILALKDLTEKCVTTRLFNILSTNVQAYCEDKDLSLQERIRSLMWVTCDHLECKINENVEENRDLFDEIINVLIEIDSRRTPSGKLSVLLSASNQILFLLKKSCSGTLASADDFLPALIYCILKANPPLLQSNICYITNFAQEASLQTGEEGYFFTNLCCAVSFIEKLTADSLGLSDVEFDHFMSGNALSANALQESYMSDAFRIMEQNHANMSTLEKRMDLVLDGYDKMLHDLSEFTNNISCEINAVIERSPLIIRATKVNIDEPVPSQELLPPPLEPQSINDQRSASSGEFWSFPNSASFAADLISNNEDNDSILINSKSSTNNLKIIPTDSPVCRSGPSSLECPTTSTDYVSLSTKGNKSASLENLFNEMSIDLPYPEVINTSKLTSFTLQGETIHSIPCSTGLSFDISDQVNFFSKDSNDPFSPIQKISSDPFSPSPSSFSPYKCSQTTSSLNLPPPLLPLNFSSPNLTSVTNIDPENFIKESQ